MKIIILFNILIIALVMPSLSAIAQRPDVTIATVPNGFTKKDYSVIAAGTTTTYNFKIHYSLTNVDHQTSNSFIASIETALTNTVNTLLSPTYSADGIPFQAPLQDGTLGGDNKYDVYVLDLTTAFNEDPNTAALAISDIGPTSLSTNSSGYMLIDKDATTGITNLSYPTDIPTNVLQTNVAHEFFHLIQYGYHRLSNAPYNTWIPTRSLVEGTAVWAESRLKISYTLNGSTVITEDKGHYQYDRFLRYTNRGILGTAQIPPNNTNDRDFQYSTVYFWKYLTERFFDENDPTLSSEMQNSIHNFEPIRRIWEQYASSALYENEIGAYNAYFDTEGTNLSNVAKDFYLALLFLKDNAASYSNLKNNFLLPNTQKYVFKQKCNGIKNDPFSPNGLSDIVTSGGLPSDYYTIANSNSLDMPVSAGSVGYYIGDGCGTAESNRHDQLYRMGANYHQISTWPNNDKCFTTKASPKSISTTCTIIPTDRKESTLPTVTNNPNYFQSIIVREKFSNDISNYGTLIGLSILGAPLNQSYLGQHSSKITTKNNNNCWSETTLIVYRDHPILELIQKMDKLLHYNLSIENAGVCPNVCTSNIMHLKQETRIIDYEPKPAILYIYDLTGKPVMQKEIFVGGDINIAGKEYDNINLPKGMYIKVLSDKKGEIIDRKKIIID
jgi:hypothetical protein